MPRKFDEERQQYKPGYIPASGPGHEKPNMPDIYKRLRKAHEAKQPHGPSNPPPGAVSWGPDKIPDVGMFQGANDPRVRPSGPVMGGAQHPGVTEGGPPFGQSVPMPGFDRRDMGMAHLPGTPDFPEGRQPLPRGDAPNMEARRKQLEEEVQRHPPSYMQGLTPDMLKRLWEELLRQLGDNTGRRR